MNKQIVLLLWFSSCLTEVKNRINEGIFLSQVKAGIRWTELSAADELSKYRG